MVMKKTQTLLISAGLAIAMGGAFLYWVRPPTGDGLISATGAIRDTKFGSFLAAQHAVYVNDFDRAVDFMDALDASDPVFVQNTKMLAEFLSGKMPNHVEMLASETSPGARMIYDTYLVANDRWNEFYRRHQGDSASLTAPMRIWASVATGHTKDAIKFINKLKTNASWQAFVRGQIYAHSGDTKRAADEFSHVQTDFMNVNDYLYLMAFYTAHDMNDRADALRAEFTGRPGGLYLLESTMTPSWETYAGVRNQMAFGLIQNVSHTQIMMYTDLSLMLLRMADLIQTGPAPDKDAIYYYMGQYFYNNNGDCHAYYSQISGPSPLRIFADMRMADVQHDMAAMARLVGENPLFVPGVSALVAHHVHTGHRRDALGVINRALGHRDLNEIGRAFFLKSRAQVYLTFGDYDAAQSDIHDAAVVLPNDPDVLGIQAKIWAAQGRELDNAYDYAMTLVRRNATDITSWDTLGRVVAARDGAAAALDLLQRVGEVSSTCSALFDQLGDLNAELGHVSAARAAYGRAIELSPDGLTVRRHIEKKQRKLK